MDRPNLTALEGARSGPFRYRHDGEVHHPPSPVDLPILEILTILEQGYLPGTPYMSGWKSRALFERWCVHYDLPPLHSLQRLTVLVERYRAEIEVDLQALYRLDLTAMWQAREFRRLLNFVDHLPANTWYHEAVVNDPDHVRQLVEAEEHRKDQAGDEGDGKPPSPPLHSWSPEVAKLTEVLDAVRDVSWKVEAVQSEKGKAPKHPPPAPRPSSPLDAARKQMAHERRLKKHKRLAARILPHKYDSKGNRRD